MMLKLTQLLLLTLLPSKFLNQEIQCLNDSDCPPAWSCITPALQQNPLAPAKIQNQDLSSNPTICIHDYIDSMRFIDQIGLFLIFILVIIAIAGGVGGGFIQIVVQLFIFEFNTTQGTPLIFITILFASSTKFILDLQSSHPLDQNKSLICWDIVLCSLPVMLMGNIIGLIANIVFPDWLILTIFLIVILNDLIKVSNKQINMISDKKVEPADKEDEVDDKTNVIEQIQIPVQKDKTISETNNLPDDIEFKDEQNNQPLTSLKLTIMIVTVLLSILTTILRGSNKAASLIGLKFCDFYSWVLFTVYVILDFILIIVASITLRNQEVDQNLTEDGNSKQQKVTLEEKDRLYSWGTVLRLNMLMLYCGVIAGILGIGGGLLIGPLMLNLLKLRPEVQGATTNVMVLSATFSGTLQLFVMGTLYLDWGLLLGVLSLCSALISKFLFKEVARQFGQSVFVLALVAIIALATFSSPILSALKVQDSYQREGTAVLVFQDLCGL